jgi:hypothetical protein
MLGESMHNYPEGYKEGPYCPYTKLVQITASLAGIELTPQTFCTEELSNARFSEGTISWLKSGDFYPRVSCVKVNRELVRQLEFLNEEVEDFPSDEEVTRRVNKAKDLSTKNDILESYKKTMDKYVKGAIILNRWRKVIFETSVSTLSDEKNEHFRQFKSADELSQEEIVNKVEQFTLALNKITGYEPNVIKGSGGAENCPQSPGHHHVGPWVD